jgi:hypothetical protein
LKTRTVTPLLLAAACLCPLGCRSPSSDENVDDSPFAYRTGAGQEAIADAGTIKNLAFDWAGLPTLVVKNEGESAWALTALQTFLSAFMTKGRTLDLAQAAHANASHVAAELRAAICASGTVSYTTGAAYLTAEFGSGCTLAGSGLAVSGTVLAGVTASSGGTPWTALDLTLTNVSIGGYLMTGHVTVSSDGTKDTLDTRIALAELGTLTFRSSTSASEGGLAVTVDGTGTWSGPERFVPVTVDGWRCVPSSQSTLALRKVHKAAASCYADAGSLDVSTPYACTLGTQAAPSDRRTLIATSIVKFLPATPTTGSATISVRVPGGSGEIDLARVTTSALVARACPKGPAR